jgi:hypothetical protein
MNYITGYANVGIDLQPAKKTKPLYPKMYGNNCLINTNFNVAAMRLCNASGRSQKHHDHGIQYFKRRRACLQFSGCEN